MTFELQFLGGAGTVTGSKYLINCNGSKILVDCGLFQGVKSLRLKNWNDLQVHAREIKAIILTNAHIDHSGYIPRIIKSGFRGKIFCTDATKDLCKILLPDSGYLMEEEAEYLNRVKRSKHKPALPLYTENEAKNSIENFVGVLFNTVHKIDERISFEFFYGGHILGAASVVVNVGGRKIAFSGDVGRLNDDIMYPPAPLPEVNYLVIESTYGNRLHEKTKVEDELKKVINETAQKKGIILIPAFAVGRAQSLMFYVLQLKKKHEIPDIPVYLNSPMATDVTDLLSKYKGLHKLSEEDYVNMCKVVKYVNSPEESIRLNEKSGPMVIISASGMLSGGRILHHLKAFGPDVNNTILLAGFQAAGTRGEALEHGAKEVKIHGDYIPINASIKVLHNISAHADYNEIIEWLSKSKMHPEKVFVTHGEPSAADELRRRLYERFGWNCMVPDLGFKVQLG